MDIQADIDWIRNELKSVKDPYLIAAFKNLLKYRENTQDSDWWDDLSKEAQQGIEEGLKDIEEGRTSGLNEVIERIKQKHGI